MLPTPDNGFLLGGMGLKTRTSFDDYWVVKIDATGKPLWQKSYGGNHIKSMAATPDGNYLLAGDSFDEFTENRSEAAKGGSSDYWLIKIDNEGHKIWDKTLGGFGKDDFPKVVVAPDGGYVMGGTSGSNNSGDKSQVNPGYWIIKIKEDQPTPTAWNMRYGGTGTDNLTSTIKTQDGGYLSGGYTNSGVSGDKSQSSQGKNDYWIVKSDKYGKKLWDKRFGGSEEDYLHRVIQTHDGGYLLAGSSFSSKSGDKSEDSKGNEDYWLVKTDAQGNKEWDKTFGGSGEEELVKVIQLSTGEYILGGHSNSPFSGDKTQVSQGGKDYWILKISNSGTIIWDKCFGGNGAETLSSFLQTPDGGYLLGGSSLSGKSGDKTQVSHGASDYWVVKTDMQGNLVWEKTFGGSDTDEAYSIGLSSNQNYYVAGTSNSGKSGDKTQESKGGNDYWLVTLDQEGNKLWDKTFGGSKDDKLTASTLNGQDHYVLAGHSNSDASGDKTQVSHGESDYWVVTVDQQGNLVQDQRYGGSDTEELRTVTPTKDGGLLLAGQSDSGVSGDRTQPSQGNFDYWLVKVAPVTNTMVAARQASLTKEPAVITEPLNLQAYPNPFQEKVTVRFSVEATQIVSLEAYDSQGQKVATLFQGPAQAKQPYEVEWQAKNQAAGLYFLRLQTAGKIQHQKLFLTR